ncbi:hypothetical protein THOM_1743, partial [Trachipleistophora hominis]
VNIALELLRAIFGSQKSQMVNFLRIIQEVKRAMVEKHGRCKTIWLGMSYSGQK